MMRGVGVNAECDMTMCCASCGIAEVDNVKLTTCACKLVRNTNEIARGEWLNCAMKFCLSNPRAAILETARSVYCHCHLVIIVDQF